MISKFITVRLRLAMGATSIVVSTLMMAVFVGLVSDPAAAVVSGRAQLCESIAVYNSTLLVKNDLKAIQAALACLAEHNPKIRSIGIRQKDGSIVFATEGHDKAWTHETGAGSTIDQIRVPLMIGGKAWGNTEVAFEPAVQSGFLGMLQQPWLGLPMMVGSACCLFFWLYLGRTLKQLDPSSAVPGRVREALDGLAESLIVVDRKGVVRFANRVFTELVGVPREKLIGRSMTRLPWIERMQSAGVQESTGPTEPDRLDMPWHISQRDLTACVGEMLELKAANGTIRTLNVSCSPILGPDGVCRGVMVCGDDVTHLEDIKKQLRFAKDRADAASAAKSSFVANMSHEIRTPLNAVLGFADVLRRGMAQSREEEIEYLDLIHRSGRHLLELINNILDLSKIESGHLQLESLAFAPQRIVHDVVSVLKGRAMEHGIDLVASYESSLPETIESDPTKLRQIVTNLVGNAIKFTEVGQVTVRVSATKGRKSQLRVDVQDTGIGMTPAQQEKVFTAFEQADGSTTRRFGGTGLGLSISRQFAEALGGTLTVTSEENVGSTFTFCLPFTCKKETLWRPASEIQATLERQQATLDQLPQVSLAGLSVLVADDAEANRRLIALILKRAGANVTTAEDGKEAIALIANQDFAVVLMDMQMPILDGYEATRLIRSTGCMVPIIALTGNAMKGDRQRCLDSGCTDFLTKPVNVDRLLSTVHKHAADNSTPSDGHLVDMTVASDPTGDEFELLAQVTSLQQSVSETLQPIHSSLPISDPEMADIVSDFVPRMNLRIAELRDVLDANRFDEASVHAHWLKGSAATTGFAAIASLAGQLEHAIHEENPEACSQWMASIEATAKRIVRPTLMESLAD